MRILRAAIYLGVVALLLPSPPEQAGPNGVTTVSDLNEIASPDMFTAAVGAVEDFSQFCARQPSVCETAHGVLAKLEAKAKYSFRLVYEWSQSPTVHSTDPPLGVRAKADPMPTGSITSVAEAAESQSTLTIEDLIPEWRGPKQKRTS